MFAEKKNVFQKTFLSAAWKKDEVGGGEQTKNDLEYFYLRVNEDL